MPNKKNITQAPPKKTRTFPRTTKIIVQGICTHTYNTRISIPALLAGKERTQETEEAFQKVKQRSVEYLKQGECPNCIAEKNLIEIREELNHLTNILQTKPLPQLEGSVKQLAFAESTRIDRLKLHVSSKVSIVREMLTEVSVADAVLLHSLKTIWQNIDWVDNIKYHFPIKTSPEGHPPLLIGLAQQFNNNRKGQYYWAHNPYIALAAWLLIKDTWEDDEYLFQETRPKAWIALQRTNRLYSTRWNNPSHVPTCVLNAINITVRAGKTWSSLDEAWNFYQILKNNESYTHMFSLLSSQVTVPERNREETNNTAHTIQDIAEQAAVIEALAKPTIREWPPF